MDGWEEGTYHKEDNVRMLGFRLAPVQNAGCVRGDSDPNSKPSWLSSASAAEALAPRRLRLPDLQGRILMLTALSESCRLATQVHAVCTHVCVVAFMLVIPTPER